MLLLGALAAALVLLWDWRGALAALMILQIGVAALAVGIEDVSAQTMLVQTMIVFLCCVMLATSGVQVHMQRSGRQSGGWLFRLLVLGLLAAALWTLDLSFVLPEVSPAIARLFGWLGLLALVILSLGDNPLFTSVALLLWCVLGYAVATFYAPVPGVLIGIGLVELALGLTCSYLILAERLQRLQAPLPLTDVAFPEETALDLAMPAAPPSLPRPAARHPLSRQPQPPPREPALRPPVEPSQTGSGK